MYDLTAIRALNRRAVSVAMKARVQALANEDEHSYRLRKFSCPCGAALLDGAQFCDRCQASEDIYQKRLSSLR